MNNFYLIKFSIQSTNHWRKLKQKRGAAGSTRWATYFSIVLMFGYSIQELLVEGQQRRLKIFAQKAKDSDSEMWTDIEEDTENEPFPSESSDDSDSQCET